MIYLSAGHNPKDKGACFDGVSEYDITPKWVDRIYDILTGEGYECTKVPTGSLTSKVAFINRNGDAKLAIECHFNASVNTSVHGSTVMYYPGSEQGKELATEILNQFESRAIFQPNRGPKEGWYRSTGKVDYFLRATSCPSCIIEPQFMSHLSDIESNFYPGCDSIAQAIKEFLAK